jgi:hypothetical protein
MRTERSSDVTRPTAIPPPPEGPTGPSRWTAGRIVAVALGPLMILIGVGLLGAAGTALWADLGRRDSAGYVTTNAHTFSTAGSAITTDPVELGDPGVGWLYSEVVLGEVRIRVTPSDAGSSVFVGIGPSNDVDPYLAGVNKTVISDFWTESLETTGGDASASPPETQGLWVASVSGTGPQTLTWDPANGSWTVVVMNADGGAGVDVTADLGATMPMLTGFAIGSFVFGGLFLAAGVLLLVVAFRRQRPSDAR